MLVGFGLALGLQAQGQLPHYAQRLVQTAEQGATSNNPIERFAAALAGHYSNKAQADTTTLPQLGEQEFICQRIWQKRFPDEYWLHIAWFPANFYKRPLAQVFLKLEALQGDTLSMTLYPLPDPAAHNHYEGECFKAKPFEKGFPFKELSYQKTCANLVYPVSETRWAWKTADKLCNIGVGDAIQFIKFENYTDGKTLQSHSDLYNEKQQVILDFDENIYHHMERLELGKSIQKTAIKSE